MNKKRGSTNIVNWDTKDQPREPAIQKRTEPTPEAETPVIDGRTLRRTGRNVQLGLKVKPETKAKLVAISQKEGCTMVEALEKALDKYSI